MTLSGTILRLTFGALIGCIFGGILTGIEAYWVVVAVAFPVLLTLAGIFGSIGAKRSKAAGQPVRQGIISTIPGMQVRPPQTGVVLNGVPVDPVRPPFQAPRAVLRAIAIVTVVVGAAVALAPAHQILGWIATDIAAGRPFDGRDMRTGLHQQAAIDSVLDVVGGTEVTRVNFFDSYILVSAPTSPGASTVDLYEWRNGGASRVGPDYSQPDDLDAALFDVADIDVSIVADLVRESIADARLEGLESTYPSISRWSGEEPQIGISLSGAYFDAYYDYSVTGELIQRSGSAFD